MSAPARGGAFAKIVVGESLVASAAATTGALVLEVPVWAMFVGWIAYFTRGLTVRQGLVNLVCVLIGVTLGTVAAMAMAALGPVLGELGLTVVVAAVTVVALSLAKAPVFNNLLGFFLGLVAFFALHQPPGIAAWLELAAATALGTAAACGAHAWQRHVTASDASR